MDRLDPDRLVRDTWQFDDLEPFENYRRAARAAGFHERAILDWTEPVIRRFTMVSTLVCCYGSTRLGRLGMGMRWRGLRELGPSDWRYLAEVMRAHNEMQAMCRYVAFVFEKPSVRPIEASERSRQDSNLRPTA